MKPLRISIFASGSGSNAEALIEKIQRLGKHSVQAVSIITDQPQAFVCERANKLGVPCHVIPRTFSKTDHEKQILEVLEKDRIDWVFLAGYMRLLSADFLRTFASWHQGASQIVNIHPSLLPAYPGGRAIEQAFAEQASKTGVTLHLVDEGMDTGPILMQSSISFKPGLLLEHWKMEIHQLEHHMYQELVEMIVFKKIKTVPFGV